MASRSSTSSLQRPSSASTSRGKGHGGSATIKNSSRPPSGKSKTNIFSKEEEYMRLNAELEAKTASLIKEAEDVLQDQEQLLSKPVSMENDYEADISETLTENSAVATKESNKKVRPLSAKDSKRPGSKTKKTPRTRPRSAHSAQDKPSSSTKEQDSIEDIMKRENLLEDRIQFANTISVLEGESEDSQYRSSMTDDVLPEAAEDLSSG